MKKFAYAILAASLLYQNNTTAQCTDVTPPSFGIDAFSPTPVGNGVPTPAAAPLLTTQAGSSLPNVEYLVTKKGVTALDSVGQPLTGPGSGDVILGADADGAFIPEYMTRYGITLNPGDEFQLIAVGYNLSQVQGLAQALLNNDISPGTPCCSLFGPPLIPEAAGFCDSVRAAGISVGTDVQGLSDVLEIFDAMSGSQLSAESLDLYMSQVNSYAALIPTSCGKNFLPLCYGFYVAPSLRYTYTMNTASSVVALSPVSNFILYPNPVDNGIVNLYIESKEATDLTMSIYNMLGERVQMQQFNVVDKFAVSVSTANLSAGMYIVELADGKNKVSQKLVVR